MVCYITSVFQVGDMKVQGGGLVHAVHMNIEASMLVVDDLGIIRGDTHGMTCTTGQGYGGSSGASGQWNLEIHVVTELTR